MPDAAVSSDFIVGFCGETEEDFREDRASWCASARFKNSFIFKYSRAAGHEGRTSSIADDVPEEVKRRRNNELLAVQNAISEEDNLPLIGRQVEVLVEGPSKTAKRQDELGEVLQLVGRTHCDRIVVFAGQSPPDRPVAADHDRRRQRLHAVWQCRHRASRAGGLFALEQVSKPPGTFPFFIVLGEEGTAPFAQAVSKRPKNVRRLG